MWYIIMDLKFSKSAQTDDTNIPFSFYVHISFSDCIYFLLQRFMMSSLNSLNK